MPNDPEQGQEKIIIIKWTNAIYNDKVKCQHHQSYFLHEHKHFFLKWWTEP